MTTWEEARTMLRRVLGDVPEVGADPKWSDELLLDGFNAALRQFVAHTPNRLSDSLSGDSEFDPPDDQVQGTPVYLYHIGDTLYWKPLFTVGIAVRDLSPLTEADDETYYDWGNVLYLGRSLGSDEEVTRYYFGYYAEITDDDDDLETPIWALEALLYYAGSYALNSSAVTASNIGQFKQRVDAGGPEDNPLIEQQREFLRFYHDILKRHGSPAFAPPFTS